MIIKIIVIILMIIYCIITMYHLLNDYRINPYNKYKIYYNEKEKYYYVKYLKSYFLPIYVNYEINIPKGFEDYSTEIIKFNSIEEAKELIESEYKYRQKEKLENKKNKKQKVYEK